MNFEELEQEYGVQKAERLAYIDFRLRFTGILNRSDLKDQFGIADAAASKEITFYRDIRPNNVVYDRVLRANKIQENQYTPLLDIRAETGLGMLANGFNKNMLSKKSLVPYERVGMMRNELNTDLACAITRATYVRCRATCHYLSASSPNHGKRKIFPTALFYDGQSWMFRAFNIKDSKFKCFNFSRLLEAQTNFTAKPKPDEQLESDSEWHLNIPLELKVHPRLNESKKSAVMIDFGLSSPDEKLIISEKAPLIYFFVKNWKIDTAETPVQSGDFNFYLENRAMLGIFDSTKRIIRP